MCVCDGMNDVRSLMIGQNPCNMWPACLMYSCMKLHLNVVICGFDEKIHMEKYGDCCLVTLNENRLQYKRKTFSYNATLSSCKYFYHNNVLKAF